MDQSGLTLPNRDYYINKTDSDEILVAYLDYMTKVEHTTKLVVIFKCGQVETSIFDYLIGGRFIE